MARLLYRLGRFSYLRRRLVTSIWAVLLVLLGTGALTFGGSTVDAFSIPGTESQRGLDLLSTELPAAAGASASVVVQAPQGQQLTAPQLQQQVQAVVEEADRVPQVVGAVDPFTTRAISQDGRTGLVSVAFAVPAEELTETAQEEFDTLADRVEAPDLRVVPGGGVVGGAPEIGPTEVVGVAVAAVVLVITLGSLVAAGMTLLTALVGVVAGMAGLFVATGVIEVSSTAPILALMLGLAVGIDYALFITSRHRTQLGEGLDPEESVARAVGTAGSAVLFAGGTVVVALAGLSVVGVPFLTAMGLAAAGTVLTAVLVALTLLPALLGFIGRRVQPRTARKADPTVVQPTSPRGFGFRWGRWVTRWRWPVVLVGVVGLGVLSLPVQDLRLALPDAGTAAEGSNQRVAYDLVSESFGAGANGPLLLVVSTPEATQTAELAQRATAAADDLDDVIAAVPGAASQDGTTVLLTVTPDSGPTTEATADLVSRLRDAVQPLAVDGAELLVTGATAAGVDVSDKLAGALPVYLALVIGLSFLLLMVAFRSILVPLKATLGFLLTVGATFGIVVAIFQYGWGAGVLGIDTPGPLVSFLPIIMMGVLFGLAMDYEVFIVSRVREEFVHGLHATEATVAGIGHGARVVTAAALIMSAVFAGFIFVEDPIIKTIGFGLTVGVLIDAFVVRMTVVPAVLAILGDRAWSMPRWLDRIVPRVDIEGDGLRQAQVGGPSLPSDSVTP